MASKNYIPARDPDFNEWQMRFVTYAAANAVALGLPPATVTALNAAQGVWDTDYTAHREAAVAAKMATEAKSSARRAYVALVRSTVRQLQANPALTDVQREGLGITVPKAEKTPVPVPASRPIPQVEDIEAYEHVLRIADDVSNRAAKPDGVDGAELWMKVVPAGDPAPESPAELTFAGYASTTRVTRSFDAADRGKTAYYRLRWVNTRGQFGQFGPQVGATIAA